ncbi:MAG: CpsB/CapC family capsule biosynthesis tyrosine phosphatase [Deltaproteobacteria bacterium]|nr:CpsB/CapC family capsule biosynthesis tyrosine phosphatase [Deltaproteobacteria bacterium]
MASSEPVNFIDIHTHILPGIDDGAKDMDESLRILRDASKAGVKRIVATPHVFMENISAVLDAAEKSFATLKIETARQGIDIEIFLGAEVSLGAGLAEEVKKDSRLTIGGGGKYILVEMPFFEIPIYAGKTIFDLLVSGVTPIWAHPERCPEVIDNFNSVCAYTDNGVKLQINSGSLAGKYGRSVKRAAVNLIENGLAHIMASDTHRAGGDETLLKGFIRLEEICGRGKALGMCVSAPSEIIGLNKDNNN